MVHVLKAQLHLAIEITVALQVEVVLLLVKEPSVQAVDLVALLAEVLLMTEVHVLKALHAQASDLVVLLAEVHLMKDVRVLKVLRALVIDQAALLVAVHRQAKDLLQANDLADLLVEVVALMIEAHVLKAVLVQANVLADLVAEAAAEAAALVVEVVAADSLHRCPHVVVAEVAEVAVYSRPLIHLYS